MFRRGPRPSHVPVFELKRTPEYIVYSIARYAYLLEGDGRSELEALQKIDEVLRLRVLAKNRRASTVEEYLGLLLATHHPDYLSHGPGLLLAALAMARAQIELTLPSGGGGCWPPLYWLQSKMSPEEFKEEFAKASEPERQVLCPSSQFDGEFAEFLARWQDGDELWRYSSPPETWRALMGRGGVVLVRGGRSVAHIETDRPESIMAPRHSFSLIGSSTQRACLDFRSRLMVDFEQSPRSPSANISDCPIS